MSALPPPIMEERSWFFELLGEAAAFIRRLVKHFVILFAVGIAFTVILAGVVAYSGSDGLLLKGTLGGGVSMLAGIVISFIVAAQLSASLAAAETIREKSAGTRILQALFARLLGVTSENPSGDQELTRALHGMPVKDLDARLDAAGKALLSEPDGATTASRIGRWLASRVRRLLVWATVKVTIAYCTSGRSRDENIDLLALRASLAREIDQLLVERIRGAAFRFMLLVALAATAAGWMIVKALNALPGS